MPADLPTQYNPHAARTKWYAVWEERGYFNADPNPDRDPHTIMIPLPNVTGALHMGHALNGTVQDLITRWRRMQGYEALWMPGTDHAGIATQAVVERRMLEEEGLTRHDIGREALVNRIWRWKDSYETRILGQLKDLGASCDWRRVRFTLDDVCSRAVRRTFFKLFSDGLIYRGKRLVNWDTYLQTAVADDEVFSEDVDGSFWTFHYPVVDAAGEPTGDKIAFSTTRPETMLGDTAVCVHPRDERYDKLVGLRCRIPLNDRLIPVIADGLLAKMDEGTGAVKVTPAHDPNDYACALRNDLEKINILRPDGTLNENGGRWEGKDRYAAREQIVEEMERLGCFDGVEDRSVPIKHSDRSKTPIEPYLSDQWFVKMENLAENAMEAVRDGRVRFYPSRYEKTYLDWLGEKRDWCISRQLWWGHRIPIWSKPAATDEEATAAIRTLAAFGATPTGDDGLAFADEFSDRITARFTAADDPDSPRMLLVCVDGDNDELERQLEAAGFDQDEDVLDTWFSSALWPHATLGWPNTNANPPTSTPRIAPTSPPIAMGGLGTNAVLNYFYPGNVLVTSRDIITLWVARMVLTGLYNMGDVPFAHVCIHPKILDGFGRTMSKSKGNGVDPMDLVDKYGTDAVRFTIASIAGETQDVKLPVGYECPHCEEVVPQQLLDTGMVAPQTLQGDMSVAAGAEKPQMKCPACGELSQFSTPAYDPLPDRPVARMVSDRFDYGRNFCNKLWNASRFAMLNLEGYTPAAVSDDELELEDRWILSRLARVKEETAACLGRYQLDAATRAVRDFTWNEFCDWYVEMVKPRLRDEASKPVAQRVLVAVLDALARLLHPFTPFVTEELWQRLNVLAPERGLPHPETATESVMISPWVDAPSEWRDEALESRFERLQETIAAVRNVRAVYGIAPNAPLKLHLRCDSAAAAEMHDVSDQFENLSRTMLAAAGADVERPPASAGFSMTDADGFIPLEGVIDREAELARQQKEAKKIRGHITGHEKKLANENFTSRAPEEVVNQVRETLESLKNQLESIEKIIADLSTS